MSSCKLFSERARSNACQRDSKRRKMPPLLRLDSTGEISSPSVFKSGNKPTGSEERNSQNQLSLKGLFDGLNMSTVLDTANSYFGTAASYIEGICNCKSRQDLARSDSDTTFLEYIKKLNCPKPAMGLGHSGSLDSNAFGSLSFANSNTNNSGLSTKDKMPVHNTGMFTSVPVSSSIFGVIQNTFVNSNCASAKSKPDPYIPPPLKKKMSLMTESACSNGRARIDPNLTPYNARLLERSKNQRQGWENAKRQHCQNIESPVQISSRTSNTNSRKKMKSPPPACVQIKTESEIPNCDIKSQPDDMPRSKDIPQTTDIVSDWFEYENKSANVIPIQLDVTSKLQNSPAQNDATSKGCSKSGEYSSPSMHSWLSVELDLDVQKATEESLRSSHEKKKSQQSCDKSASVDVHVPQKTDENYSKGANDDTTEKNESEHAESKACSVFPQILYIRNIHNGRKCRPSSKKRRRQKIHPNDVKGKSAENESAKHPTSSVAFILGIDKDDGQSGSHSFLLPCDTDSSSDWSDSDLEVDDDEDTPQFCPLTSPFGLFNLEVMCSIQQTTPPPCSTLDAVNLAWQLSISMDSDQKTKKKNSPAKKVQFSEDKHLETVHHMVAWSYAYAAARKGPWEEIARDRGRFQRRITDGDKTISPILENKHRERIYAQRFDTDS